ncbi:MAG: hypothetical protein M5U09_04525 [Gammaproteobacteria bacterium]|nr:hypothetical protein [Gammaproteobacteria bacterium]
MLLTYLRPLGIAIDVVDLDPLTTPSPDVADDVACLIAQQPNFLGYLEGHAGAGRRRARCRRVAARRRRSPQPGAADAARRLRCRHRRSGDGQRLGNPTNFGGPSFGFLVVGEALLRQFPGRLVGQTEDVDGRRAFGAHAAGARTAHPP